MVASYPPSAIRDALDRAGRKGSVWLSLAADETSSGTAIFLHKLTNGFHTRSPPKADFCPEASTRLVTRSELSVSTMSGQATAADSSRALDEAQKLTWR
jgi:hypothetical protein